jgi:SNF2 family DNA or RNA helicase
MARKAVPQRELNLAPPPPRWKHQEESLEFLSHTPRAFDNSDPGTGKTRVQIEHYVSRANRKRWLVLCPKTLMQSAWAEDIERFGPRLSVSLAYADRRDEAFRAGTDVVVMNHDATKWLVDKKYPERVKYLRDFDHLTIDEYTAFKHMTSLRSKGAAQIRKFFEQRHQMSGTPNANSVMELWHPALIADDGKRMGMNYYQLRSQLQHATQIGYAAQHVRWDDKPGAAQLVHELLKDITIRHAFEDVMTHVPPNHKDIKSFTLSPRAKKLYDQMENSALMMLDSGDVITSVHAASLRQKLLQIASGAVYDGGEDSSYKVIDPQRYELIADLIEERDHSITFFNWKHQRDLLLEECRKRHVSCAVIDGDVTQAKRDAIVTDYQAGMYQTLLLHPRTGAHGLTLTRGTTTIISSPFYEADLLKQAIHRIYRGDQNQVTNTLLVQAKGTVEELVYERLDEKYGRMVDLLDLMKNR